MINSKWIAASTPKQWVDLGCGDGLFSRALQSLLHPQSTIYAIDKKIKKTVDGNIKFMQADFEKDALPLPVLNGMLMANSLHFVKNKTAFLQKISTHLRKGSHFILIEYDTEIANPYMPYPLDFLSAKKLFNHAGFKLFEKIQEHPSVYNPVMIYAAQCVKI